ncbi:PREDICTED: uncharacterized protein At4g14100-like isoform X2 [Tarenaya hassleriana]|uniref:uncharacterized protein At4g14100-like isoform X2 n=1 Tax=Tarenaya hassleriana TaxID=28532 RepID=UPI00053C1CC2|nr:PREDICTED: uncharacterized protein At4g14100-like isoform X2 [Tarenaya hassleriana]
MKNQGYPLFKMASSPTKSSSPYLLFIFFIWSLKLGNCIHQTPKPQQWPLQFHAVLFINNSGSLQKTDLWYDWVNGRNFNIIQKQLGELTYDLEWNNGTSFYYTLGESGKCREITFEVGILRPNWLEDAEYVGVRHVDGFLCNAWTKVDFIWYYEDVESKLPAWRLM